MDTIKKIPGYTGTLRAAKPPAPYDSYEEDVASISASMNSSLFGPAVHKPVDMSATHSAMVQGAAVWKTQFAPDTTFHTRGSPEKSLMEAELQRRQLERTRKEGLAAKAAAK